MSEYSGEIIYPSLNDENFTTKLQSHPIFNQYKYEKDTYILEKMIQLSDQKCSNTGGYIYKNIQLFVSTFLSMNSPYNGLLLYHGVGVGKSCSSILIANNFKEYVKKNNKKIIILTSRAIQDSFRNEVFNSDKEANKIDLNEFTCTSNEYSNEWNDFLNNKTDSDSDKNFKEGIIGEYFEIYGYQEFVNRYKNDIEINTGVYNKERINALFSNTVFIIDEVHNLRDNLADDEGESDDVKKKSTKKTAQTSMEKETKGIRKLIQAIIENLNISIKLVLLSATPMYDLYNEFNYIINLLLLNDKKSILSLKTIDNYIINNEEVSYNKIMEKTRGYVSYIKGNDPLIFPLILYPENNNKLYYQKNMGEELINSDKINAYLCEMSDYQTSLYKTIKKGLSSKTLKEQYSNLTFPLKNEKPYTFNDLFDTQTANKVISYKKEFSTIIKEFLDNIENYSTKIGELIKNITNCKEGKIFIYTPKHLGDYAGTEFLKIILEHNGYCKKTVSDGKLIQKNAYNTNLNSKSDIFKGYYIIAPADKNFNTYINNFNMRTNNLGNDIKIIIGTTNMFEGVSLSNIRQIHIMEPWYNLSRNEQIVGRGVRQCSHIDLPFEKRNLTVFNYVAICDKKEKFEKYKDGYIVKYTNNPFDQDLDIRKLSLATNKIVNIDRFEELLKINSIDCYLNKNVNDIMIVPLEKSEIELYNEENIIEFVDYKNDIKLISFSSEGKNTCENIEKTNNNYVNQQYKTFLNKNLINNTTFFIKTVFKKGTDPTNPNIKNKIYYTYDQLFLETLKYNNELDEDLFKISLQELLLTKEIFYNKFNNSGYIIVNGQYYIFKNINSKETNIPFEFIAYPYNTRINNISNFNDFSIDIMNQTKPSEVSKPIKNGVNIKQSKNIKTKTNLLNKLLLECQTNNLQSLVQEDFNNIYKRLHDSFKTIQKNKFEAVASKDHNFLKHTSKNNLYENIFKQLFKKDLDISKLNTELDTDLLDRIYEAYFTLPFIFNYSEFITTHLKCIFYKVFIKKKELTDIEKNIFDHYENLIVSENPLIFKFIDWSGSTSVLGDSDNTYNYNYLGTVFYEYFDNEWIFYNKTYSNIEKKFKTLSDKECTFYKIMTVASFKLKLKITDNKFIINELYGRNIPRVQTEQWERILKTFDYHSYTDFSVNDGYFKYSGNPSDPFSKKTEQKMIKLSNIIGLPLIFSTDNQKSFYKLSRNIYPLCLLYSAKIPFEPYTYYIKQSFHSNFIGLGKEYNQLTKKKHILLCILDQVEELNIKLCLEIILNKNITNLWEKYDDFKFKIRDILENIDLKNPILDVNNYNLLKTYLDEVKKKYEDANEDVVESLNEDIEEINKDLNENKNKFYKGLPFIYDLIRIDSISDYIMLIGYILYDLEKLQFYNKKWLLSIFESALLNTSVLNMVTTTANSFNDTVKKSTRIADTYSVTKNSFISSKIIDKKSVKKFIELDIE